MELSFVPRLRKKFDNALLTQIRNAVYFGGANYEIAQRLKIDRKTWYNWRQNESVKKAIQQGQQKRWKRNIQQMGWNFAEVEADFDRMYAELDQLNTDYNMETFTEGGYRYIVETVRTANGIKRTTTKAPELVPLAELMRQENL
jgi:hypothetical protein